MADDCQTQADLLASYRHELPSLSFSSQLSPTLQRRVPRRSTDDHHGGASIPSVSEIHQSTSKYQKINDSVYQLHVPSANQPDMDVLFFHGLHLQQNSESEDHIDTWRSTCTDRTLWPKEWLPKDFPDARVLIISYDGGLRKTDKRGRMDLYLVAESLLTSLLLAKVGQIRPVILIGHSYGGLVIKQLCVLAHSKVSLPSRKSRAETEQLQALLESIGGIFYYGTPHRGSRLMDVIGRSDNKEGELVKHVKVFSKDLARLDQDFQNLRDNFQWHISAVGETRPTDLGGGNCFVIVEEGSARCDGFVAVQEDHISICKPEGTKSSTYETLVNFIREVDNNCKPTEEISSTVQFPGDYQMLPKTQVGLLACLAGGEILEKVKSFPVLGLWGMGGIGKTTLSKAIFNHLHSQFQYTLFVENVKLISVAGKDFEETLVEEIHERGKKIEKVVDKPGLSVLTGKEILMVLDDIDAESSRDIEIVRKLWDHISCSANSRIILTSRDRHILEQVDGIHLVEVEELDRADSETLFKSYAVSITDTDSSGWQQNCMESIVERCRGVPLVLEVIGKYLRGSDSKDVWEETDNSLAKVEGGETTGMNQVWAKLQISYDNLGDEQKQIFLDASTFFQDYYRSMDLIGWDRWTLREAKAMWGVPYGNPAQHWRRLVDRALVYEVGEDSPIEMHEHFRTMGRNLVKGMDDIKRIRCEDVQDLSAVLHQCDSVKTIQTVQLFSKDYEWSRDSSFNCFNWMIEDSRSPKRISIANLERMEMLQYLQLEGCRLAGRKVTLPRNVLMFSGRIRGENLSFDLSRNLLFLIIDAYETKRLPRSFYTLRSLQFLQLEATRLQCFPESLGCLSSLQRCTFVCPLLEKLPESLGDLGNLRELTLSSSRLKSLPSSIGRLKNLQQLEMGAPELAMMPDSFGTLEGLHLLRINEANKLERLPNSFGNLKGLKILHLDCISLETLPSNFGEMKSLQNLKMISKVLPELPDSFCNLKELRELHLDCCCLRMLPSNFGEMKSLETFKMVSEVLTELPDSFGNLKELKELDLACNSLEMLPSSFGEIKSLQKLTVFSFELKELPDSFCNLKELEEVNLYCSSLGMLPSNFGEMKSFQKLQVWSIELTELHESFCNLKELRELKLRCDCLWILPSNFGEMKSLETLEMNCKLLIELPDSFVNLKKLKKLHLSSENLQTLPDGFGDLEFLEDLNLWDSRGVTHLTKDFRFLGDLKVLRVELDSEIEFHDRVEMNCLQTLGLKGSVNSLPDVFWRCRSLQILSIFFCSNIECLPEGLGDLKMLEDLRIEWCEQLQSLPETLGELKALKTVTVGGCDNFARLPKSLVRLESLTRLELWYLPCLRNIPDLHMMDSLETLDLFKVGIRKRPRVSSNCEVTIKECSKRN